MTRPKFKQGYKPKGTHKPKKKHKPKSRAKTKKRKAKGTAKKIAQAKSETMTASLFVDERTGITYLGVAYDNAVNGRQFAIFDCDLAESPKKLRMALKKVGAMFTGIKADQIESLEEMLAGVPAATGERTLAAGAVLIVPIFSFPGGRRFHVRDPGGNEIAVMQPDGKHQP